jgi:hypothetical protein
MRNVGRRSAVWQVFDKLSIEIFKGAVTKEVQMIMPGPQCQI